MLRIGVKRLEAFTLNTAAKGLLTGVDDQDAWMPIGGLEGMGEAYSYWVGQAPDPRHGIGKKAMNASPLLKVEGSGVPQAQIRGSFINNIGLNAMTGRGCRLALCEEQWISNGLNQIPGWNGDLT